MNDETLVDNRETVSSNDFRRATDASVKIVRSLQRVILLQCHKRCVFTTKQNTIIVT